MAEPAPRYKAFISYRHVDPDRAWARWLHRALETYRVPKELRRGGVPVRLGRVFRDEEELAASADLSARIDEALDASEVLIVICSPRVVESRWCNREIERFRELGRGDRILALLIEGEPHESFPPALRAIRTSIVQPGDGPVERVSEVEPLAADVRPVSGERAGHLKGSAKLRIIATLLGVRYDDLVNREQQRRARRLAATASMAIVIMLAMGALAFFAVLQRIDAVNQRQVAEAQRAEAERRRDESDAVVRFLRDDVLSSFRPERMPLAEARAIMVDLVFSPAAEAVQRRFAGAPLVEAAARDTLAVTFETLGRADLALPHAEAAVRVRMDRLGPDHVDTLSSQFHLAYVLFSAGRAEEAEPLLRDTVSRMRVASPGDRTFPLALTNWSRLLNELGREVEAEPISAEAVSLARTRSPRDTPMLLSALQARAGVLAALKRHEESERLNAEALALCREAFGDNHPATLDAMSNHAYSLINVGRVDEAGDLLRGAFERSIDLLGEDHPSTIMAMFYWGFFLVGRDNAEEGEPLMAEAVALADESPALGTGHPNTRMMANRWIDVLELLGRDDDAQFVRKHFFEAPATQPDAAPPSTGPG